MTEILYSPMAGKVVDLNNVNDEMFSQRLLGDGVAVIPEEKEVYSPIDGVVTMIYDTKHAIGIKAQSGLEIIIHIGIDTMMLNGVPFDTQVNVDDNVKKGDLLTIVDLSYIKKKGYDTIVPIIVINKKIKPIKTEGSVRPGEALFEVEE